MIMKKSGFVLLAVLIISLAAVGCAPQGPMTTDRTDEIGGQQTGYNYNDYQDTEYGSPYGTRTNLGNRNNMGDYRGLGNNYGVNNNDMGNNYGLGNNTGMGGNTGIGNNTGAGNNAANYRIPGLGTPMTQTDSIARACENVAGVENATVVVAGDTAYVGIDLEGNRMGTNNANLNDVKRRVAQTCRNTGNNINTVYVSADANFMDRLRRVGNGIREGRPVDGFRTELTELVRRLTPERQ